jgi:hypothetical protein
MDLVSWRGACVLAVVATVVVGSTLGVRLWSGPAEAEDRTCSISGRVLDLRSGRLVYDGIAVVLDRPDGRMDPEVAFPRREGTFAFRDLEPGEYRLSFDKSYRVIVVNDPDAVLIEGGYIPPAPTIIDLGPGEAFEGDFHFDFRAHLEDGCAVERPARANPYAYTYADTEAWPVEPNILGKTMHFEVRWTNTALSRADLTILVLGCYNSTGADYSAGPKAESLDVLVDADFFEREAEVGHFEWRVLADPLPSPDRRDIPVEVSWCIE